MRRTTSTRLVALVSTAGLVVAGCGGGNGGDGATGKKEQTKADTVAFSVDDEATGPAPAVEGAKKGGTILALDRDDYGHLDPARIYVNNLQTVSGLITRTLNGYREDGKKVTLVGDLSKHTGKTEDGGKTWTFELRDGVKFEDGTPITSQDIKYGVERTFAPEYTEGPTYVQEWLTGTPDFRKVYDGPYKGKSLDAIATPDEKTIVFTLKEPHADFPYAMALPGSAPVKKEKDTKAQYDLKPFASGPYRIKSHTTDKSMELVRNEHWDTNTDPIRNAYPDAWKFEFGTEPLDINKRLIAAQGNDVNAMTITALVSPEVLQQVDTTPELKARTIQGYTQFVLQYNINNSRVKELEVRKALLYAFPRFQARQVIGGSSAGDFASTVLSPTVPGYQKFDLWKVPPQGDPEKAKKILTDAGKLGYTIVYGHSNTPRGQQVSVAVAAGLTKAGFKVVKKPIPSTDYYDIIGKTDNKMDLYSGGWGADWPSAATVIPPTLDGRKIGTGLPNYSHFNDPEVNAEIDRILKITDLEQAAKEWGELDKKIMAKIPYIPYLYDKAYHLYGKNIGGVELSTVLGEANVHKVYIKG